MSEGGEVALRRLPEGIVARAIQTSWNGRDLELELIAAADEFGTGALAEIETSDAIYLGVVRRRQGLRLSIAVEHWLDKAKLARIQALWNETDGEGKR